MEKTGEIQVNINGQYGTSTNEVQFTYQVSVYMYSLCLYLCTFMCMENLIPFYLLYICSSVTGEH